MTKMKIIAAASTVAVILFACGQSKDQKQAASPETPDIPAMEAKADTAQKINIAETELASKKDPVCGMPAFRYLADTAVVDKKIYGFCSGECKEEFKKEPGKYIGK